MNRLPFEFDEDLEIERQLEACYFSGDGAQAVSKDDERRKQEWSYHFDREK